MEVDGYARYDRNPGKEGGSSHETSWTCQAGCWEAYLSS